MTVRDYLLTWEWANSFGSRTKSSDSPTIGQPSEPLGSTASGLRHEYRVYNRCAHSRIAPPSTTASTIDNVGPESSISVYLKNVDSTVSPISTTVSSWRTYSLQLLGLGHQDMCAIIKSAVSVACVCCGSTILETKFSVLYFRLWENLFSVSVSAIGLHCRTQKLTHSRIELSGVGNKKKKLNAKRKPLFRWTNGCPCLRHPQTQQLTSC